MAYYPTLKEMPLPLGIEKIKLKKKFKKQKLQKLVSFCVFVLVAPKRIARKMVITSNFVSQNTFIIFQRLQPETNQTKDSKNHKKQKKLHHFEQKNYQK